MITVVPLFLYVRYLLIWLNQLCRSLQQKENLHCVIDSQKRLVCNISNFYSSLSLNMSLSSILACKRSISSMLVRFSRLLGSCFNLFR
jgi:hypothetical protein